jgi:hypothetical protein
VELTPSGNWLDASTWQWRLDEDTAPGWWEDVAGVAEDMLRARAQRMILTTGVRDLIVDGCWILGGDVAVRDVRGGRILRVQDTASISDVSGSASISNVRDSASISNVRGSASIRNVWGSASIRDVWGSASISNVRGSASITGAGASVCLHRVADTVTVTRIPSHDDHSHDHTTDHLVALTKIAAQAAAIRRLEAELQRVTSDLDRCLAGATAPDIVMLPRETLIEILDRFDEALGYVPDWARDKWDFEADLTRYRRFVDPNADTSRERD